MRQIRYIFLRLKIVFLSDLQYRSHFFAQLFESGLSLFVALLGVSIIFANTASLGSWSASELTVLVGIYMLVKGGIGVFVEPSMSGLMDDVRSGDLDFALLRPFDSQLMVTFTKIQVWKLVDVIVGLITIVVAQSYLETPILWQDFALFLLMLMTGIVIIYCYWFVLSILAFWLIAIENIITLFQDIFEAGRWPTTIHVGWLRTILTFLVPVTLAITVPAEALLGQVTLQKAAFMLLGAIVSVFVSRQVWFVGLRNYSGASA